MPHQCLQCGKIFKQGSTDLLKGCPSCGGTRFFFTNQPLSKEERDAMMQKANHDLRNVVAQMMQESGSRPDYDEERWSEEKREEWVNLRPKDIKNVVREIAARQKDNGVKVRVVPKEAAQKTALPQGEGKTGRTIATHPLPAETAKVVPRAKDSKPAPSTGATVGELHAGMEAAPDTDEGSRPETLRINEPGDYELDVKRLLESEPIIIQKNGTYMIHLPSVFEELNKGKK
ncbi:MAG: hypothetical protein CVT48_01490 [Thermoplasmata archaeon HGW-Thermoplasmata-1]|nr:MAG: hypothetical protein CVT48_01490 [Thermoplasmata archaeon HGW-Thermoplasmata-1]